LQVKEEEGEELVPFVVPVLAARDQKTAVRVPEQEQEQGRGLPKYAELSWREIRVSK
jgi:hypothetical protein